MIMRGRSELGDSDKGNTKHHFLPVLYLRGFSDNGRINVFNRVTGALRKNQNIQEVASVKGLYSFGEYKEKPIGDLEDAFAIHVEEPVGKVLKKINGPAPSVPVGDERSTLATFIALQHLRTPASMRRSELVYDVIAKAEYLSRVSSWEVAAESLKAAGIEPTKYNIEEAMTVAYHIEEYEVVPPKSSVIEAIVKLLPEVKFHLTNRYGWSIFTFDKPSVIVGDEPVFLLPYPEQQTQGLLSFPTAKEIHFPLSATRVLVLEADRTHDETVRRASPGLAQYFNERQLKSSYLECYSHPAIRYPSKVIEPGPRPLITVTGPYDFFEDYDKPPARLRPKR